MIKFLSLLLVLLIAHDAGAQIIVRENASPGSFDLVAGESVANIVVDPSEPRVVQHAAAMLAEDVGRVTSRRPAVVATPKDAGKLAVFVATLGQSAIIHQLASQGKIDIAAVKGKWETFQIAIVDNPLPGVDRGLIVAGSDRRGTAYGALTISEAIGVSPWCWWADAPVMHKNAIHIDVSGFTPQGPVVKYRGIFINDEDWGIHQWASKNFEKDLGDIGPRTYARVFELLLRLKANYCWPAMHPCTRAFNAYPQDKDVADEWGIVMGSSHCEPLLRDNVDEWHRDGKGDWNWVTNKDRIIQYLRQRVEQNGRYENVWTVGMRGIHDSGMPGGGTLNQQTQRLQDVIAAERKLLAPLAGGDASKVPQVFIPYKEALAIYSNGMRLPDDVTIVWPDDNQGYIRRLSTPQEQQRSGGGGVYYHCSYWGDPVSYLWLDSTPPMQIWLEMTKAAAFRCDRLWVLNVGDIKPAEKAISYFFELAWNPANPALEDQNKWLVEFARRNIDPAHAEEIGQLLGEYYHLCAMGRPEHLGRSVPADPLRQPAAMQQRIEACQALYQRAKATESKLPPEAKDAYFELALYPISGMTATNIKFFAEYQSRQLKGHDDAKSSALAKQARDNWAQVLADTRRYNEQIAAGKWRGIMDNLSSPGYELKASSLLPPEQLEFKPAKSSPPKVLAHLLVTSAQVLPGTTESHWKKLEGIGYDDAVMVVEPRTMADAADLSRSNEMPGLRWSIDRPEAGPISVQVNAIPAHPPLPGGTLRCAISVNGQIQWVEFKNDDEYGKIWATRVLLRRMSTDVKSNLTPGSNQIVLRAMGPELVVDSVDLIAD